MKERPEERRRRGATALALLRDHHTESNVFFLPFLFSLFLYCLFVCLSCPVLSCPVLSCPVCLSVRPSVCLSVSLSLSLSLLSLSLSLSPSNDCLAIKPAGTAPFRCVFLSRHPAGYLDKGNLVQNHRKIALHYLSHGQEMGHT